MNADQEVLFEEKSGKEGHLGIITLNRPTVLNSINLNMIHAMHAQLMTWASAEQIKAVIIRAVPGRAFCAGGDLRLTYERHLQHDPSMANFFHDEYQLNRFIHHYPKPYIALLDGITMGGGVGISIHGSHRVVTDHMLFAMPETGIGFFPDVGGTYFLPRLPGKIGFYLGLTGARLGSDDCVAIGIATQKVARESLAELTEAIAQHPFGEDAKASVTEVIERFAIPAKPSQMMSEQSALNECFSAHSIEDILQSLHHSSTILCKDAGILLEKKSPTSLKITLRALQEGKQLDFDACMRQEFRLVCRFLEGHDFAEGIRAVIIDKDQTPHWKPATLKGVSHQDIEHYFAPLTEELV